MRNTVTHSFDFRLKNVTALNVQDASLSRGVFFFERPPPPAPATAPPPLYLRCGQIPAAAPVTPLDELSTLKQHQGT